LLRGLGEFMFVFGGGLLVGLSVGFGAEIISSLIDDPLSEAVLSISIVYGAYALATSLGFSGLVAVAVSGLYYGNVTMRSVIQPLSRSAVKTFWRILAYIANSVAFLFIGLNTDLINLANAFLIILIASVTVFVSRMVAVYPIMHIFGRRDGIPSWWNNTIVAGGMRGAISVVLIASIPTDVPLRSTIATLVLGVVFISVIFQGPFLSRYIERHFERGREESRVTQSIHNDLSEAGVEIARLSSEWEERSISDEELAAGLERERDRLTGLITDVNRSMNPGEIMRSRALSLYRSMTGFRRRDGRSDEQKEDIGIGENGDKGRKEN
ncbi:MAG: cation:proton antiporter, partial [Thermoplasmata archaeon]|nr:cation:proton antiporter [Candidatus Sysuiplasma superficiale]